MDDVGDLAEAATELAAYLRDATTLPPPDPPDPDLPDGWYAVSGARSPWMHLRSTAVTAVSPFAVVVSFRWMTDDSPVYLVPLSAVGTTAEWEVDRWLMVLDTGLDDAGRWRDDARQIGSDLYVVVLANSMRSS